MIARSVIDNEQFHELIRTRRSVRLRALSLVSAVSALVGCSDQSSDRLTGVWVGDLKLCRETVLRVGRHANWQSGERVLKVTLQQEAASRFARMTAGLIGKHLEIRVNGKLVASPIILQSVSGGSFEITGLDQPGEQKDAIAQLREPC